MATAMINWAARAIESVVALASYLKKKKNKEESSPLMSLSDLPENVIDDILSRLPTKDAGRTAVLSRPWRHRWRSIPDLDLSDVSDLGVCQALRLHVGPIRLFKVKGIDSCAIDSWLAALSSSSSGCLHTLDLVSRGYSLQLGTLARFFPRLAHLRLARSCISMLPELDSSEFAILQTLHLELVYASDEDDPGQLQLSMFVPACPLLETLAVRYLEFEGPKDFCYNLDSIARDYPRLTHLQLSSFLDFTIPSSYSGLTSLRTLNLNSGTIYGDLSVLFSVCPLLENLTLNHVHLIGKQCLDIVAPNLRFLVLVRVGQVEDFSIASAPALETAVIDLSIDDTDDFSDGESSTNCNMTKVLAGMPCVKKLELHPCLLKFLGEGHVPENFPISFDHLRYMSLKADLHDIGVLRVTLCLLRSAPNLQELDLKGSYSYKEFPGVGKDFWEAQEHLGLFDNLERVKVTNIMPFGAELEFIRFVLSKARALITMMVNIPHEPTRKKLLMFPRISNQVKIIFI